MKKQRAVFALCGSFCTFGQILPVVRQLRAGGWELLPLMSFAASGLNTRFGTAEDWQRQLEEITGRLVITTLQGAEPLGPKDMADVMIIAPCTGTTLAKLNCGISDTPVTLGAKSMLRRGKPVVLAPSTNDGLAASAQNLGALLNRKNYYVVPLRQDDYLRKPTSLQSDFSLIGQTAEAALEGRQLQPLLLGGRA